jgi:hypothetical protein
VPQHPICVVGLGRLELPTSRLSGVRSSQLSYRPTPRTRKLQSPERQCIPVRRSLPIRLQRSLFDVSKLDRRVKARIPSSRVEQGGLLSERVSSCPDRSSFRKEVIQPQVLLQLPCYDFTPIMDHAVATCLLAVSSAASSTTHFRDVTGGVYKTRERIHRGMLIRDY